jgi:hypothetical protein
VARCGYCGATIIFGGTRLGEKRLCDAKCARAVQLETLARSIPQDVVERRTEEIWRGACPKCGGLAPVDAHKSYHVWSALCLTRWTTKLHVSCHSCAVKRQFGSIAFSLLFGWWGFPWGFILTPVQIGRNLSAMRRTPDSSRPSDELRRLVLNNLGEHLLAASNRAAGSTASASARTGSR